MKVTSLRCRLLELLFEKQEPLSHTEIFEQLAALGQVPNRVTLYRVLAAFSDAQIVHQVQGTDGTVRFCLHPAPLGTCPGNHPHFLCRACGRMICLTEQALPRVEVPKGTIIEGKQLLLFGLCALCARPNHF
jgi:Fur family ferric uptake transcriptional regulator/Fur family zinc uptake transcriptional regulator